MPGDRERTGGPDGAGGSVAELGGRSTALPSPGPIIESAPDPVVEAYKRDIDRTLLRQNLRRTVTERVENLIALQRLAAEAVRAGRSAGKDP